MFEENEKTMEEIEATPMMETSATIETDVVEETHDEPVEVRPENKASDNDAVGTAIVLGVCGLAIYGGVILGIKGYKKVKKGCKALKKSATDFWRNIKQATNAPDEPNDVEFHEVDDASDDSSENEEKPEEK